MRAVLQRVNHGKVTVEGEVTGEIANGLVILLGVTHTDDKENVQKLASKITKLRIFSDDQGKMNLSIKDVGGEALVISQFTLYADSKKGNRPSYIEAARPEQATPLYEQFCETLRQEGLTVATGVFGADMNVELLNQGPVTIILDTDHL